MKNVLILSAVDNIGGAEIVLKDFLLNNSKHNFYLLTSNDEKIKNFYNGCIDEKNFFGSKNFKGYYFKKKPFVSLKKLYKAAKEIHFYVKKYTVNVIYGNNTKDLFIILFYKKFFNNKIKVISHIHDMLTSFHHQLFFKIFGKGIDVYITPSKACKEALIQNTVEEKKIICVYNGVKVPNYRQVYKEKNEWNIFFIGNICFRKRVDLFIEIIENLCAISDKKITGYIIGEILEEKYYKSLNLENKKNIKYLGKMTKLKLEKEVYPAIDFLLLCSDKDPLPTVILEAMSYGKIVFARNVDGVHEIIDNEEDGFIFDYNAEPMEIAKHLYRTITDINKLNTMSLKAIEKVKYKFDLRKKNAKINKIIEEIE